ncbi:MAG: hemolysin family protein [Phascolarctobacterium sp.]|nr:hemolysin family protein [Phascolarctobacterium sp.]
MKKELSLLRRLFFIVEIYDTIHHYTSFGGELTSSPVAGDVKVLEYLINSINVIIIILLVAMNGFFVASEFSIVKIRPSRLDTLIKEGNSRAKYAKEVTEQLDAYLSVTQLGITLASLGLGWIGEPTVIKLLAPLFKMMNMPENLEHTIGFLVGFSVITAMHIVCGELVPKSLSIQKTESIVLFVAWPLIMFHKLMYPAVWFMNHVANWILGLIGIEVATESEEAHNEEEIRLLMEESHKHGYIDKTELTYLDNVFDFSDRKAGDIMVPRTDMVCLYLEDSFQENMQKIREEKLTRYPVCKEDKDHIVGFLHIKDVLNALALEKEPDLAKLTRKVLFVPETLPVAKLLRTLQKNRAQLAILLDEFGGTQGMVTIEDILEELVGEIQDEFDEERPEVEDKGNKIYSVDGKMLIEDVNETFELDLNPEEYDTIGGWLYNEVDLPARVGKTVETDAAIFTIEEIDSMRIDRVGIKLIHEPANIHEEIKEDHLED